MGFNRKNMKQKIVGVYRAGSDQVQLVIREGTGGEFYTIPEKGSIARIRVGVDYDEWGQCVSVLLHEIGEFIRTKTGNRLIIDNFSSDTGDYIFHYTHAEFSDICTREGMFLVEALPDLADAWKEWKKNKR
jgi:hypothetical protein